jgi:hypothetical protein
MKATGGGIREGAVVARVRMCLASARASVCTWVRRVGLVRAVVLSCVFWAGECARGLALQVPRRSLPAFTMFTAVATCVIMVATVMTTTPLAYARISHFYESVITEVPEKGPGGESVPAPGQLSEVNSMTAHSGDLYVYERIEGEGPAPARTDQWAPSGSKPGEYEFVSQLPLAVPELGSGPSGIAFGSAGSEPEMYLAQTPFTAATGVHVFAAGSCGTLECATFQQFWTGAAAPSPFEGVGGVAVDHSTGSGTSAGDWASGDVFVVDGAHGVVDIFEPKAGGEEHYVGQVTGVSGPIGVSGFNGDLVVGDNVFRPEQEGGPKEGKYASACQLSAPGGPLEGIGSVAIDDGNGEIYVTATAPQGGPVFEFGPDCSFLGGLSGLPKEGTAGGVKGQTEEVPFGGINGLAVDPESHRLLVAQKTDGPGVIDVFGPDLVLPDVVSEEPSNLALNTDPATGARSWGIEAKGSVNPLGEGPATCSFAWGLTEAFGQQAPCAASVEGASPVAVSAGLAGLEPDTTYVYRLAATNKNGTNQGQVSQDQRFTTPGPGLHSESASEVSSSSATLEGSIAPHDAPIEEHDLQAVANSPTAYFFQYSGKPTSSCSPEPAACRSVPSAPANLGSGTADVQVSEHLSGLTANTTYHYRLVAENEALPATEPGRLIAFYGPDRTFTTQGLGGPVVLPDERAWELVSPADKHGARINPFIQSWASVDGGGFTFLANMPTEPEPSARGFKGVQVLASRVAPGEWSSVDISLSRSAPEGAVVTEDHEYRFFSPDFGLGIAESEGPFSIPEGTHLNERGEWERVIEAFPVPTERTPYLRHNSTCASAPATCYEPLLDSEDVTSGERFNGPTTSRGAATFAGATPDARHALIDSTVQLTQTPAEQGGLYEWSADKPPSERLSLVNVVPETGKTEGRVAAGISPDGKRVLFIAGGLYLHDATTSETVRLDLTESGAVPAGGIGVVGGTSTDLSKVFFTDETTLTKDSGTRGQDLYVCELGPEGPGTPKCALTDLTLARATGKGAVIESAEVSRVLNVSPDGSYVYFLARGIQAAGATPGDGERENVYVAHEHEGNWVTSFIASAVQNEETVISPNGRWLAFSSSTPLTGYDNRDAKTGTRDSEVYVYGAEKGTLVCASCDPSGARPIARALVPPSPHAIEGLVLLGNFAWQQEPGSRSLFDGGRLFFDSGDALVPQDTNGNTDVYEYEPAGVGGCTATDPTFNPAAGGCTGLISSGRAAGESLFMEASATGSDVFFTTAERLVRKDTDTAVDVYDAHECTALAPCASEATPPKECESAAECRLAPTPPPGIFGSGPTESLVGNGNALPVPTVIKPKTAAQLRAEKLAKLLEVCRKKYPHSKKRRSRCERAARRVYGPKARAKKSRRGAGR